MGPAKLPALAGIIALLLATLSACGFKGPLTLPEPPSNTDQSKKS